MCVFAHSTHENTHENTLHVSLEGTCTAGNETVAHTRLTAYE
jgi:hypothetical protein